MSNCGGRVTPGSRAPLGLRGVSVLSKLAVEAISLRRLLPLSARRRRLNRPSSLGDVERVDSLYVFLLDSGSCERSFHAAMMFRTDVSGERGGLSGRRRDVVVEV
jgi:hypothetical protein